MDTLIARLAHHQPLVARHRLGAWAAAEPALAGAATSAELIRRCHQPDPHVANATLGALLRIVAWDRAAAEVALVALAPGLGRVIAGLHQRDLDDVVARVVAEGWAAIVEVAGRPPTWPAAVILDRVRDRVRAQLVADRRHCDRTVALDPQFDTPASAAGDADSRRADTDVLGEWVAAGRLAPADAWLIRVTRLDGLTLADVARATGARHDRLRRRRSRAERSLRAAA